MKISFLFFFIALACYFSSGKSLVSDKQDITPHVFIKESNKRYLIKYPHVFTDTLYVPSNCTLVFDGGSLSGPIVFNETKLSGLVDLKGSSVYGSIKNKVFNASWICEMDGNTDDASSINQIIELCGDVFFPKGIYRLVSEYDPQNRVAPSYHYAIKCHIGINRSDVHLKGEEGTVFLTTEPLGTICAFTPPNQINNSIRNLNVENIQFVVKNDGEQFNQYMHTIKLVGVNHALITGCFFDGFWGDAICLSHYNDTPQTGERTRNQNVNIYNNTIIGSGYYNDRNGISIISGKNVKVINNIIKNTSRVDMPGGIDIEPNNSAYTIENIKVEKNYFEGIQGGGGAICIVVPEGGPAHNIYVLNNKVIKSKTGIFIYLKANHTTDHYVIKGNYIDDQTRPFRFEGEGQSRDWVIIGNTFDRPCKQEIPGDITVDNLIIKKNKKKD